MSLFGLKEATKRQQGRREGPVMLLHFNKQPIKHLSGSGERSSSRKGQGGKKIRKRGTDYMHSGLQKAMWPNKNDQNEVITDYF